MAADVWLGRRSRRRTRSTGVAAVAVSGGDGSEPMGAPSLVEQAEAAPRRSADPMA